MFDFYEILFFIFLIKIKKIIIEYYYKLLKKIL